MSDYTDIQSELDDFKNAVYGEEVRDSMVSAIKKIHDIAESAADAPDASSAAAGQSPVADGAGGWAWGAVIGGGGQPIPVTLASDMTDTSKVYLYLGNESGYQYGYIYAYANGAWTSTGLYGRGQDGASGADGYSPTATVTQTATGVGISITDANGTTTATVENGTATDAQVEAWLDEHPEATTTVQDGSITSAKLATSAFDNTLSTSGKIADAKVTGDAISDSKSRFDKIWISGKNLFDKDDVVNGKYISTSTGSEATLSSSSVSNFIEIEPNTSYIISCSSASEIRYAIYDDTKNYISGAKSSEAFITPSNAGYIRFSIPTSTLNSAQLEEGNTVTSYEPYSKTIAEKYILSNGLKNEIETLIQPVAEQVDGLKEGNDVISFQYNGGFIGSNGAITNPTANQEVYTNKVAVNEGDEINVSLQYDSARAMWFAYATYDENETFKSRVALINGTASTYRGTITIGSGVKYVVFTFRTYGVATFNAYRTASFYEELSGKIDVLDEKVDDIKPLMLSKTVKSIAHRGDDVYAPQCTAPAYIIARKRGFEIAENDVWLSEDGYYVMEHDTTLSRLGNMVDINGYLMYTDGTDYYWVHPTTNEVYTYDYTNEEYVSSAVSLSGLTRCAGANYGVNSTYASTGLNLDVLKRIDFGVYKGSEFAGTQILTFEEWVLLCKQLGMEIYIDRKWAYTNEQIADLANIVKKYGMGDKASWLGMDGAKIIALRNIIPDSRCCLLQHPSQALIDAYTTYNTGRGFFFNGNGKTMTEEEIQLGLNAGFEVEVWFVDYGTMTEEQILETIRTAVSYGVTGLTLDHYKVDDAFMYLLEQY